jgi:Holliday junction resolvase
MSRGHDRERAVKKLLEMEGWFVIRAAASLGFADLVALRDGDRPQMIEVKSTTAGPYHSFGPADRRALIEAADRAGAIPLLCWWPPRRDPKWLTAMSWPS